MRITHERGIGSCTAPPVDRTPLHAMTDLRRTHDWHQKGKRFYVTDLAVTVTPLSKEAEHR